MAEINKKNAETIDSEGWLHSGDKGCMDARGLLKITGRYKELIIGAGGENIAPVPIEDNVKRLCPAISNFMMVGDMHDTFVKLRLYTLSLRLGVNAAVFCAEQAHVRDQPGVSMR